jgi:hypothetical protein
MKTSLTLLSFFICSICFAQNEYKLNKPKKFIYNTDINGIQVTLRVDTAQKMTGEGLKFSIKIKNDSTSNIIIRNPMDFLSMGLTNEAGIGILPNEVSRLTINTKGLHSFRSFSVEKITSSEKELKNIDLANVQTINIPAKSAFEIFFKINRVLKTDAVKPYTKDSEMEIPKGRYRLFFITTIMSATKNEANFIFTSPPIYIRYGN